MTPYPRTVCRTCGVTSVRGPNYTRDYAAVRIAIRLKAEPRTSYIVTPEVARLIVRILNLDNGADNYVVYVPLDDYQQVSRLLSRDDRIEEWHTEPSTEVCEEHLKGMEWRYMNGSPQYLRPLRKTTQEHTK